MVIHSKKYIHPVDILNENTLFYKYENNDDLIDVRINTENLTGKLGYIKVGKDSQKNSGDYMKIFFCFCKFVGCPKLLLEDDAHFYKDGNSYPALFYRIFTGKEDASKNKFTSIYGRHNFRPKFGTGEIISEDTYNTYLDDLSANSINNWIEMYSKLFGDKFDLYQDEYKKFKEVIKDLNEGNKMIDLLKLLQQNNQYKVINVMFSLISNALSSTIINDDEKDLAKKFLAVKKANNTLYNSDYKCDQCE